MKIATRSVLTVGFCLLVAGFVTNAFLLPHAEAQNHARKNQTKAISSAPATGPAVDAVVINELDADQEGTDAAEFVELRAAPNTSFDGYVLVFYTGSTDTSYLAIDLDGLTADANGLVLIGNAGVPGVDRTFGDNVLQQGEDAVALYLADATAFPNGTAVTAASIVDAVVYDTNDPDDPGLMGTLLNPGPAQVQINESMFGTPTSHAIRRCSDGVRDGRAFTVGIPTPNAPNANCPDGKVDLNGDGKSDFLIARTLGGGAAAASAYDSMIRLSRRERFKAMQDAADAGPSALFPIEWWGLENGTSGVHAVQWGDRATDEPITADFDRDGKDDIAVWRPAEENEKAYFYSIDSSNFAFRATAIGQKFDNPYVIGDYDGDGFDDPAVFRCPPSPGTCYFYYLASSVPNSGFYAIPFGLGEIGSVLPYVGDFNGDDKTDYGVATASPSNPSNWIFYIGINGSSDVSGVEWGSVATDRLVPGDFDGDGKTDIVVTRVVNDVMWWYVLEQDGGMQFVPWGQGGDFELIGDYNGDGRDDFAVYRWNAEDATFLIQPSGGGSHFGLTWGLPGDYPVAYFFVQ